MRFIVVAAVAIFTTAVASVLADGPATAPAPATLDAGDAARAEALRLLSAGRQSDAESLIFNEVRRRPTVKTAFFSAVLIRSRFEIDEADRLFSSIVGSNPDSVEGRAAKLVVAIDADQSADASIHALDQLAAANPADPLVLWMVAVECRQLHKNKAGIERYQRLLKVFDPGPVLMHQTLGNLLLDDGQAAAALKQYDTAIAMEPAAWDYNCRGNALTQLNRPVDAAAAYRRATELDPDYEYAWQNWAKLCASVGDFKGAADKMAKADDIDRRSRR